MLLFTVLTFLFHFVQISFMSTSFLIFHATKILNAKVALSAIIKVDLHCFQYLAKHLHHKMPTRHYLLKLSLISSFRPSPFSLYVGSLLMLKAGGWQVYSQSIWFTLSTTHLWVFLIKSLVLRKDLVHCALSILVNHSYLVLDNMILSALDYYSST